MCDTPTAAQSKAHAKAEKRNEGKGLQRIVERIAMYSFAQGMDSYSTDLLHLNLTNKEQHTLNGAEGDSVRSIIHPLTAVHYTLAAVNHYTVQGDWLQTLALRCMGVIKDGSVVTMSNSMLYSSNKQDVKKAWANAMGHEIKPMGNIHFYPAGGTVDTCEITLDAAMQKIRAMLGKCGEVGRQMIEKDRAMFNREDCPDIAPFRLPTDEKPHWDRLASLLDSCVNADQRLIAMPKRLQKQYAVGLLDVLTRARDGQT